MPLQVYEYNNVIAHPIVDNKTGIYQNGTLIPHSTRTTCGGTWYDPIEPADPTQTIDRTVIFAGFLLPHYGHFLLEGLATYWYIKNNPDVPIFWLTFQAKVKDFQRELFKILQINNEQYVIYEPTRITRVIVPEPGMLYPYKFTKEYIDSLAVFPASATVPGKKIWVSRSNFPTGKIYNEKILEKKLEEHGWLILDPEAHSKVYVLEQLSSAERIAGIEGSAFHVLILLDSVKARVDLFVRKNVERAYEPIATAKNFEQYQHNVPLLYHSGSRRYASWVWYNVEEVLRILEIPPLVNPIEPRETTLTNGINMIIQEFNRENYLEMNAGNCDNFACIVAENKTAVEECYSVNFSSYTSEVCHFYEMKPDIFLQVINSSYCYDVLFFNQLETFEEVFSSFVNSQQCSASNAIWVLNTKVEITTEQAVNVVPFLHMFLFILNDFYNNFDFCIVSEADVSFVVVWKKSLDNYVNQYDQVPIGRQVKQKRFKDMQSIITMTYEEYVAHKEALPVVTISEMLELIKVNIAR